MEPLLVYPDPPPRVGVAGARSAAGYPWRAVSDPALAEGDEPEDGYAGAVISALEDPRAAFAACRVLRKGDSPLQPSCFSSWRRCLAELELREDLFDDFVLASATAEEVEARLTHLFWRTGRGKNLDLIVYGPLALNLETYQAAIQGRPLDLTYMEYELLRFLAAHPGPGLQPRDAVVAGVGL